ncbi:MAG: NAD(P)-dependent oxidoreductase [Magnetococcales bacterium]|nr:NAD(P)-dependent oxidoreductase [Magnetococcales bacterium]
MARILISGAAGFLGGALVRHLAGSHDVWCLARRPGPKLQGVTWVPHDLACGRLPEGLPDRIDAIAHLAQSKRFREFPDGAADMMAVNVAAPLYLADWARQAGARTFVYASTGGVYAPSEAALSESDRVEAVGPLAFYCASKLAAEMLLSPFGDSFAVVVLRPFFIYGPSQPADMLMPRLVQRIRNGEPLTLQGSEGMRFNPIHVEDAARLTALALNLERGTVLNLAGPEVTTLKRVGETLAAGLGVAPLFITEQGKTPPHLVADTHAMTQTLGNPAIGLEAGLASLWQKT